MKLLYPSLRVSLISAVLNFALCQAGHAQEADTTIGEAKVKLAIEETAELVICLDQTLLDETGMDVRECRKRMSRYTNLCWAIVDKLVSDYELPGNDIGKERFEDITDVYIHCVQAELLMSTIRSKKKPSIPHGL